jgi:hypothetical protein
MLLYLSMSNKIELVGLVVQDSRQDVLLLHRRDHNQWQLPGGRMFAGELRDEAAARHSREELNMDLIVQRYLGRAVFSQCGVMYGCDWHQAVCGTTTLFLEIWTLMMMLSTTIFSGAISILSGYHQMWIYSLMRFIWGGST